MSEARPGSFDRVAAIYDATRGLPPEAERQMAEALAGAYAEVAANPRVLEVGIGTGRIALPLARRGCRVVGVDLSPDMLAHLRGKRRDEPVEVTLGSALDLPLRERAFDGALFVHVLHLVPDATRAIHQALARLRPGGRAIFAGEDFLTSELPRTARRIARETIHQVSGLDLGGSQRHAEVVQAIQRELAAAGSDARQVELARWETPWTAADWFHQLERKDMSWMWPIPDADLPEVLRRVREPILELFGGLERVHAIPRSMSALVGDLH